MLKGLDKPIKMGNMCGIVGAMGRLNIKRGVGTRNVKGCGGMGNIKGNVDPIE